MPVAFLEALGIHLTPVFNSTVPLEREKEVKHHHHQPGQELGCTTLALAWQPSHTLTHTHTRTGTLESTFESWEFWDWLCTFSSNFITWRTSQKWEWCRVQFGLAFSLAVAHRSTNVNKTWTSTLCTNGGRGGQRARSVMSLYTRPCCGLQELICQNRVLKGNF